MLNDGIQPITGYLIDPEKRIIEAVEIKIRRPGYSGPTDGGYESIREHLGYGQKALSSGTLNEHRDHIWCEDDPLLNGACFAFLVFGYRYPVAGRALILGSDQHGGTTKPWLTEVWLKDHVRFLGEINPRVSWVEDGKGIHPVVKY